MRVAVSGAGGRLGRALVDELARTSVGAPWIPVEWHRRQLDLDRPAAIDHLLEQDEVDLLVHAAAWTDVDGCARDPQLAHQRNGLATGVIAEACARRGLDMLLVSTNEVFDGRRTDGRGYAVDDPPNPINAYGASKLAGEQAALEHYQRAPGPGVLGIVRTAWLFGPPGNDFPAKIAAAARRASTDRVPLRVVRDEVGSPTYAPDLAEALVEMIRTNSVGGVRHVVNAGVGSRADWAREIIAGLGVKVEITEIEAADWPRTSTPPRWAVLSAGPMPSVRPLRPWREALAVYLPRLGDQESTAGPLSSKGDR